MEKRLEQLVNHPRFLCLSSCEDNSFSITHIGNNETIAMIKCGNLSDVLNVWESLCEGWLGDDFDGIN